MVDVPYVQSVIVKKLNLIGTILTLPYYVDLFWLKVFPIILNLQKNILLKIIRYLISTNLVKSLRIWGEM